MYIYSLPINAIVKYIVFMVISLTLIDICMAFEATRAYYKIHAQQWSSTLAAYRIPWGHLKLPVSRPPPDQLKQKLWRWQLGQ